MVNSKSDIIVSIWHLYFLLSLLYLQGYFMTLPFNERMSGIKHLQMMTNLTPIIYWSTCFLWDYICYVTVVIITLVLMYTLNIFAGNELCKSKKCKSRDK